MGLRAKGFIHFIILRSIMEVIGCPVLGLHADFPEFIVIRVPIVGFLLQYGSLYKFAPAPFGNSNVCQVPYGTPP